MAHENHIVDRLSTRLPSLLPEHIQEDAPVFEMFLQAYFEYLESEIIVLSSIKELEAIKNVFGENLPKISSTKSLTGHSLGATGVHEAIYCLLMMNNNFLSGSANINTLDDSAKNHNILLETEQNNQIENILSNSFGFGGTNATLLMSRYND